MIVFKCKMCGGSLEIAENQTTAECEYCGTKQTLPKLTDDKRTNLYDRANHFRRSNEFDKAEAIYENILAEDGNDAEAYWSLVLCRYGVEYVEDPATKKRIPTVNRAQYTSIFDDDNYRSAIQYADAHQKAIYEEEATVINEIQKGILAISEKEAPFDVFICYKETDRSGKRTRDSVLAQDLYYELVGEGFKVFFSRITLEDKLGVAYEPYIFAALQSAKVMVVVGTEKEYFEAVWVKNEWSRFLSLVKQSKGKKMLIPAYRDMDPYELPEEFSHLQAQDMSKLGFMQDLIHGITKLLKADASKTEVSPPVKGEGEENIAPLLKRMFLFLEDGDFQFAKEYCERVLDREPENAEAYIGRLMVKCSCTRREFLAEQPINFEGVGDYQRALRFSSSALKEELIEIAEKARIKWEEFKRREKYEHAIAEKDRFWGKYSRPQNRAIGVLKNDKPALASFINFYQMFFSLDTYREAKQHLQQCKDFLDYIEEIGTIESLGAAAEIYSGLPKSEGGEKRKRCERRIEELKRIEQERQSEEEKERERKQKREIRSERRGIVLAFLIWWIPFIGCFYLRRKWDEGFPYVLSCINKFLSIIGTLIIGGIHLVRYTAFGWEIVGLAVVLVVGGFIMWIKGEN